MLNCWFIYYEQFIDYFRPNSLYKFYSLESSISKLLHRRAPIQKRHLHLFHFVKEEQKHFPKTLTLQKYFCSISHNQLEFNNIVRPKEQTYN